jgi:hypothetical protein
MDCPRLGLEPESLSRAFAKLNGVGAAVHTSQRGSE